MIDKVTESDPEWEKGKPEMEIVMKKSQRKIEGKKK